MVDFPTVTIALNRTVKDGNRYGSALTAVPEEWLVERDWYIVHHWQDQFCRDLYQDLCKIPEMQRIRASAMMLPNTTPQVCPVDHLVNTPSWADFVDQIELETLDPCVWKYVFKHESLAQFRLSVRSDVIRHWNITHLWSNFLEVCSRTPELLRSCSRSPPFGADGFCLS